MKRKHPSSVFLPGHSTVDMQKNKEQVSRAIIVSKVVLTKSCVVEKIIKKRGISIGTTATR
jgi:hypothetical protein